MEIIPAIDIMKNQVVRLIKGVVENYQPPARRQRILHGRHDCAVVCEVMIGVGDEYDIDRGRRQGDILVAAEHGDDITDIKIGGALADELEKTRFDIDRINTA